MSASDALEPAVPGWLLRVLADERTGDPTQDSVHGLAHDPSRFGPALSRVITHQRRPSGAGSSVPTRSSAVLMLFGPDGPGSHTTAGPGAGSAASRPPGPSIAENVLLTRRSAGLRSHPGQVAFPGGRIDPTDDGPVDAALREATEEVGLQRESVHVLGRLPELGVAVSRSAVTPVLGWWAHPHPVSAVSADEVEQVAVVPVADLVDPANRFVVAHSDGFRGPAFEAGGLFIWGFTALLLDGVLEAGGLAEPWDVERVRGLPDDYAGRSTHGPHGRVVRR